MKVDETINFSRDKTIDACKKLGFFRIGGHSNPLNLVKLTTVGRVHVLLDYIKKNKTKLRIHHDIFGPIDKDHYCKRDDSTPKKFYNLIMNELYDRRTNI